MKITSVESEPMKPGINCMVLSKCNAALAGSVQGKIAGGQYVGENNQAQKKESKLGLSGANDSTVNVDTHREVRRKEPGGAVGKASGATPFFSGFYFKSRCFMFTERPTFKSIAG